MKANGMFNRHKFIDDYTVREELGPNGKTIKKAYYSADYYVTDWDDKKVKSFKIRAILLSVAALAASAVSLSVKFDAYLTGYVILAYAFAAIFSVLMLCSAFELPKNAEPMERSKKYYGFDKFKPRTIVNCACGLYGAVANTVHCFIVVPNNGGSTFETPTTGMNILVSVFGLIVFFASLYCLMQLKTANIHVSDKENDWDRLQRELRKSVSEGKSKDNGED